MTTNFPAQSRPPPTLPPPPDLFHPPRRRASIVQPGTPQPQKAGRHDTLPIEADGNDRAPKRRKLESPRTDTPLRTPLPAAEGEGIVKKARSPSPSKLANLVRDLPETDLAQSESEDDASESRPPIPFPGRPWKNPLPSKPNFEDNKYNGRIRKKIPVPNTPDKLENPATAPTFGKCVGKCPLAGFFPWTGKHPEDVLTESTAKHGYYDRPQSQPEKEQGSAKTPLHHAFKHKFGLETLSTLFSSVLDHRSKHGTVSLGSAFKPPPRVTLTETKRKSWLTDLANVEVSLRKLSKTVPQGIRGQALLEQCLLNSVPINRAIWFAKCVGANEIRIMKRAKPTGNMATCHEGKWLKDWTSNVEQFIEATLRQCGQPEWRDNIQYVLKLCTRLYLDNLLDRDHYLDWVVKSLAAAGTDQLPFWLMVVHIYHQDLVRFRRRGKKLAESLLEKVTLLRTEDGLTLAPLITRLKDCIRQFAEARPLCFLMPDRWSQIHETIKQCLHTEEVADPHLLSQLERMNARSLGADKLLFTTQIPPRKKLIQIFDAAKAPFDLTSLSNGCRSVSEDEGVLIPAILEWATTRFRHFQPRLYLAVRLLRRWDRLGYVLEPQLLEFIAQIPKNESIDRDQFHHLMLELSRSKTFSVSKYMQWLVVKGTLSKGSFDSIPSDDVHKGTRLEPQMCPDPSQILTHISLDHIDVHVKNLRNISLVRAGFDSAREIDIIEQCKLYLGTLLPSIIPQPSAGATIDANPDFASLPWSIKSSLAHWLRSNVALYFKASRDPEEVRSISGMSALDIHEFCTVRDVLERMDDLAVLADVLAACLSSTQEDLLAAIADTVFHHSETLSAIGAFEDLHHRLCQIYVALRTVNRAMPLLATSMVTLCRQYPSKVVSLRTILTDFRKGDRARAVAACSPFSDGVAESLQQAGETFLEDFEVILLSEPSMNEETMHRLFSVLTERISKTSEGDDDPDAQLALCQLLARLRLHRNTQCDQLVEGWLVRLLTKPHPCSLALVAFLVATSCITFEGVVQSVKRALSDKPQRLRASFPTLARLFSFEGADRVQNQIFYRLNLCRSRFVYNKPLDFLLLASEIKTALGIDLNLTSILPGLVSDIILSGRSLLQLESNGQSSLIVKGLDLIGRSVGKDEHDTPGISSIARSVDDLSLPFCQARLKLLVDEAKGDDSIAEHMANDFFEMAKSDSLHALRVDGFSVLQGVSLEIASRVRQMSEEAFFASLPTILQPKSFVPEIESSSSGDVGTATRYLSIAFGAAQGATSVQVATAIPQLIDKLSNFLRLLSATNISAATAASPATPMAPSLPTASTSTLPDHMPVLIQYLPLLLQMACLERPLSSIPSAASNKQTQQDQVKILVLLVSIALHPALLEATTADSSTDLISFALDVAATMVEDLSDEARMLCSRFLKDKMRDARVQFLFGSVNTLGSVMSQELGAGLQMVKQEGSGREVAVGEWKPRQWEVLQGGAEPWVGLGIFGARKG